MAFGSEYTLENVEATPIAADKIDATFRASTIGEYNQLHFISMTATQVPMTSPDGGQ